MAAVAMTQLLRTYALAANETQQTRNIAAATPGLTFDIQAYDVDGNTVLDQETIETAVYPFLGPQRSKDDVNGARNALQKAYQARGYQTVIVEIPPQDARSGFIRLHVAEAPVGRFRVVGSNYYSLNQIKKQVPSIQEGKVPNITAAQKEVTALDQPDRRIAPLIKPGKIPGTVDVDLRVNDTLPLHGSLEVNNDHAQNTTAVRTTASVSYANLWQLGHTLSLIGLLSPKKFDDTRVFSGSYLAPISGTPWSILVSGYDSHSNVPLGVAALGGTGVLGNGHTIGVRGILALPPIGDVTQTLNFGIDYKHAFEKSPFSNPHIDVAAIDYFPLVGSYTLSADDGIDKVSLSLTLTMGLRGPSSSQAAFFNRRFLARSNFVHVNVEGEATHEMGELGQIGLRFSEQLADGPLVSGEQFAAGGLTTVRGYLLSEAIGDDGVFSSLEMRSPSFSSSVNDFVGEPLFEEWRVHGFVDGAVIWVLDPLPEQQSRFKIASVGLGTRVHAFSHLTSDLNVAFPLVDGAATSAWRPYFQFSVKSEL
ncbi:MAG: ShlB/FhaC/HecB family hemolysin secretion/activation protein [Alphaproteobacteria bacterium]|nr:ShlB/FhaC/HecB family hemolysin secretion/activation protein [Alphaproteobacteria bacterium]